MTLQEQIDKEYLKALKSSEAVKLSVLRLLKTAAKNRLVELKNTQGTLNDEEMLNVILKQAKQRQDSIEQYMAASRSDLAEKEKEELEILRAYLPELLTKEETIKLVEDTIKSTGASTPQDAGKVIGLIMGKFKGRVDGKLVSGEVKRLLTEK